MQEHKNVNKKLISLLSLTALGLAALFGRGSDPLPETNHHNSESDFKLTRAKSNNPDARRILEQLGRHILDLVVLDPDLKPTFLSPSIGRVNRTTGNPDISILNNDKHLSQLLSISQYQSQCARANYRGQRKNVFRPTILRPIVQEGDSLSIYLDYLINALHMAHISWATKGSRCGPMADIASLYIVQSMLQTGQCVSIQSRQLIVPHHDQKRFAEDVHGYLLVSPWDIPRGRLTSFSKKQQTNIFILDPFRDLFISVKEALENPRQYPYFDEKNKDDGLIHPFSLTCPDSDSLVRKEKQYPGFQSASFFKILHNIDDAFSKKQARRLPPEFVCEPKHGNYGPNFIKHDPVARRVETASKSP